MILRRKEKSNEENQILSMKKMENSNSLYWSYIGVTLELYWSYIRVILELYWSYIGVILLYDEKTSILELFLYINIGVTC